MMSCSQNCFKTYNQSLLENSDVRTEKTVAATFPVVQPVAGSEGASGRRQGPARSKLGPGLLAGVLLLFALIGGWYLYKRNGSTSPAATTNSHTATERNVSYWLTVQKVHAGRPEQDEFESSGREIFGNGWKFVMNISSPQAGYLYLLNEGPVADGTTTLNVLFPAPATNSGASYVAANQQIKTGWMQFDENQGTETFWLVWAASPVPELEAAKGAVNEKDKGTIRDESQAKAVRDFLISRYASTKPELEKDNRKKQTNVKSKGDVVISFVELEHH
jgi:hypothetical protein